MNIRKPADYSVLFEALSTLMAADLPQMKLYSEIGRLVSSRPEKGAAVAAAEYLQNTYPDFTGFSPRNLRRMRDFYRAYENTPKVMAEAVTIGWTQNTTILETKLTLQEKLWYIRAVQQFGWSKLKLMEQIASAAHLEMALDLASEVCYTEENSVKERTNDEEHPLCEKDRQPGLSSGTAQAGGTLKPWLAGFCAMGTPIPMGTIPAPSLANNTRKASGGRPCFDHRAGRFSMRGKMAALSLRITGKLNCLPKQFAAMSRISPQLCWEPTICFKALALPPRTVRSGWNSS